ncbi:MAG: FeoB-associated Cys-rich membrane protein [Ruminococcus sp.]|uniref:FeoB-associated Cys-rich membrane protein n=1 Tax=Ruminococcus sp. TaxID=41978 RepID=UPI001AFD12E5|nr:FeoB-associated Cys-rich membrane protein [Ruminococcus sp.]MBO7474310.1 FeoB-associated Cys-rich membrane protein [Ruminococcus sp.]MBP5432390.1 FeoB-associated Cys-rich membrane protein [Ruminococcus sp.]
MLAWLAENLGTIVISLILAGTVTAIIVSAVKDRKQGKSSCGCNCEHCAMHGKCHK